jgi:hypothetical protein
LEVGWEIEEDVGEATAGETTVLEFTVVVDIPVLPTPLLIFVFRTTAVRKNQTTL